MVYRFRHTFAAAVFSLCTDGPRRAVAWTARYTILFIHSGRHFPALNFTEAGKKQVAAFEKGSAESFCDSAGFDCKGKGRRVTHFAHDSSRLVLLPILEAKTGKKTEHEEKSK